MLPFIYCICTAFKPLDELLVFPPRFFVHRPTVENFVILPTLIEKLRVPLSRYIFNTAFITFAGTALHIIVASMAAYVLAKTDIKFKKQYLPWFSCHCFTMPTRLRCRGI